MTAPSGIGREALRRIIAALVVAEARRTRGAGFVPVSGACSWPDAVGFDEAGIGLDSLDAVHAAAAINGMFHLADAEPDPSVPRTFGAWLDRIGAAQAGGVARVTVLTSGSTGRQKPCTHAIADLSDEADHFAGLLADRVRVLAFVPAHHIYGLIWTALLPERLDIPVLVAEIAAMPELRYGDLIVAVPDQWRALLRSGLRWPDGVIGVSAGAPLDDDLAAGLHAAGLLRLIDVYGSSETGGVAARDAPGGSYALLPRWRFAEAADVDAATLLDRSGRLVELPDGVNRMDDGTFLLTGRRDGAVQIGGVNVWLGHVAAVLRRCPGVADVAVRMGRAGRMKAFVVPTEEDDRAVLLNGIKDHARRMLTAVERPVDYLFGPSIPTDPLGKAVDWSSD
jgi:4-coumarate--CoA ligase (photoactive yellow protein activation family)